MKGHPPGSFWRALRSAPSRLRPTFRWRLALLYAGLTFLAGAVVLAAAYGLFAASGGPQVVTTARPGGGVVIQRVGAQSLSGLFPKLVDTGQGPPATGGAGSGNPSGSGGGTTPPHASTHPVPNGHLLETVAALQFRFDKAAILGAGAIGLLLVSLLALGAGWIMAGKVLNPIRQMADTASGISASDPDRRLGWRGPQDELKALADAFDGLLNRLHITRQAERRFIANASHELRTPLAAERTLLEVTLADPHTGAKDLQDMARKLLQLNQRSRHLVEGLLDLAVVQEQGVTHLEPLRLDEIIREVLDAIGPEASARRLSVTANVEDAKVRGDRVLLERLVANLMENAVRHNVDGGHVDVSLAVVDERAVVTVSNGGPGIPADEVERLFQPFQRSVDRGRDMPAGAGLGLAIVRAIAVAHGGDVRATSLEAGGLEVVVTLPALPA